MVCIDQAAGNPAWILPQRQGTDSENRDLRPALQPKQQTLCVDRNRRLNPGQNRQTLFIYFWDEILDLHQHAALRDDFGHTRRPAIEHEVSRESRLWFRQEYWRRARIAQPRAGSKGSTPGRVRQRNPAASAPIGERGPVLRTYGNDCSGRQQFSRGDEKPL